MTRALLTALVLLTAACASPQPASRSFAQTGGAGLNPNETRELRSLIEQYADFYEVPPSLIHRVIQRESDYRPGARNGPYYGLMQILPETAATMGHSGGASSLLDAETNLRYGVKYLRGAWLVANGNQDEAVRWYASGYYYEARNRCMLVETGLRSSEVRRHCG
ncbi:transglycosylase SLT domain-containing protein [Pelagovum pacificum]|uniref:Lytic transglycosylase domain-containing protein n=1 Tax=Pelagovum pacificum TaxID=2588711 RepID=A0A5C5GC65_9RHOB|nr:lytic transglycosylase domain-containing protein [Pelagovum pacificum]QQA42391.1 lytic transglycosylase domain-containing protein [Pelagovum pacificum]TNY31697.1 lytic transglycosylase domain-containing protein [Pelagovum pacificum]